MSNLCPHCEQPVDELHFTPLDASDPEDASDEALSLQAVTYACPHCHKILGCQVDPMALKQDIVNALSAEMQRLFRS
ncbi:MAG: hypothetical protein NTY19_49880 [Planctomycetota bacterium]|nr:hypothetical protein [Planctomycetota bacterium]